MTPEQFESLAREGYNRIPVTREILADLDTPLSTYLKLAKGPYSYLLESVHGGEKWGRYSIIGLPCETVLRISGNEVRLLSNGEVVESVTSDDPGLRTTRRAFAPPSCPDCRVLPAAWSAISAMTPFATSSHGWRNSTSPT
jgi:anthranilate synthase component 1